MRGVTITVLAALLAAASAPPAPAAEAVPEKDVARMTAAAPAKAAARPKKPRKLLVYTKCRGFRHGAIPHGSRALEIMGTRTGAYKTVVTDDDAMLVPQKLREFDAVCINNATTRWPRDGATMKALHDYVAGGRGLVGIHAATDGTAGHLFGGLFSGHPWNQKVAVKNDEPKHPLNAAFGGRGFEIADEIYQFTNIYSRGRLRVLLSLDMAKTRKKGGRKDNDYAVSWVRRLGKGRVFYCSMGHRNDIFWNPMVLRHYLDGIQFAMGDLQADASPSEKPPAAENGWVRLFNGKDLTGWQAKTGSWVVEEGGVLARKGGGSIWTKDRFGDFILELEFKLAKGTNSGVFIRTGSVHDSVQTGIEVQLLDSYGKARPGKHDCGAVYDCLAPGVNAVKPAGEWNRMVITCKASVIQVLLNGRKIIVHMDLDKWAEPGKNPDGSRNKFRKALKDFPREGHIGFQDHGRPIWFRNVRLKPLK